MHSSSELTGTDFSAVKHQSHQPSSTIFHQKQEMNSSDFFRAHWSRHVCCKALVDPQAYIYIYLFIYTGGIPSEEHEVYYCDISPSLADPALLSVVRVVDGQLTGFITKGRRNFIYKSSERTGPGSPVFKASAGRPA